MEISMYEGNVSTWNEDEVVTVSASGKKTMGSSAESSGGKRSVKVRNKRPASSLRSDADLIDLEPQDFESHTTPKKRKEDHDDADDGLDISVIEALGNIYREICDFRRESDRRHVEVIQRLDALEAQLAVERSTAFPRKPDCLPLRSVDDLLEFRNVEAAEFDRVVDYLGSLSSGSIAERANLILKDAIVDDLAPRLTIQGHEPYTTKVEGTRFFDAIYAALCIGIARNERPSRRTYVTVLTNALKAAKQRYRRLHMKMTDPLQESS